MKGGEVGTLPMPIFLTDDDIDQITRAYVMAAKGGELYRHEFSHPTDAQVKVRLVVPGHPNIKWRCLRAELVFQGEIIDFSCFKRGFKDPVVTLQVPETMRVMVQLDTSKVTGPIPELPYPSYD